jgi:hypothetical protein
VDDPDLKLLIGILIVAGLGAAGWYFWDDLFPPEPEPAAEVAAPATPAVDEGPGFPMPEPLPDPATGKLVPLPALDDSDAYFLLEVEAGFGEAIAALLKRESVIDRLVASIDNLTRPDIPEQVRPVNRLEEAFRPDINRDGNPVLGFASYLRYDAPVAYLYYADVDTVYDTYRRFYPLFQGAYERLGYPDAYFNDRLVEVIDHLLAAPEVKGEIALVQPNVLYEFADPELEKLSSGQKLMLRMGPDNAATTKRLLVRLRERLAAS